MAREQQQVQAPPSYSLGLWIGIGRPARLLCPPIAQKTIMANWRSGGETDELRTFGPKVNRPWPRANQSPRLSLPDWCHTSSIPHPAHTHTHACMHSTVLDIAGCLDEDRMFRDLSDLSSCGTRLDAWKLQRTVATGITNVRFGSKHAGKSWWQSRLGLNVRSTGLLQRRCASLLRTRNRNSFFTPSRLDFCVHVSPENLTIWA